MAAEGRVAIVEEIKIVDRPPSRAFAGAHSGLLTRNTPDSALRGRGRPDDHESA